MTLLEKSSSCQKCNDLTVEFSGPCRVECRVADTFLTANGPVGQPT